MLEEEANYTQKWADCVCRMEKITVKGSFLWKRNAISLKMVKDEGFCLFDEFATIRRTSRDAILNYNWKTWIILFFSGLQSKR